MIHPAPAAPSPRRRAPSAQELAKHMEVLRRDVFRIATKTPQFEPMLKRLESWAAKLGPEDRTLVLERGYLHDGNCIFAPIFAHTKLTAGDCIIATSDQNRGFLKHLSSSPDLIDWGSDFTAPINQLPVADGSIDFLTVPNVVHHVRDQDGMFAEWARVLRRGGHAFVFEGLVRELHQVPDDYVRYTPWGFEHMLQKVGLELASWEPVSGPFDVLAYVWQQALDFFPEPKKSEMTKWFFETQFPQLQAWDREYRDNLREASKIFPMGFLFEIRKP